MNTNIEIFDATFHSFLWWNEAHVVKQNYIAMRIPFFPLAINLLQVFQGKLACFSFIREEALWLSSNDQQLTLPCRLLAFYLNRVDPSKKNWTGWCVRISTSNPCEIFASLELPTSQGGGPWNFRINTCLQAHQYFSGIVYTDTSKWL